MIFKELTLVDFGNVFLGVTCFVVFIYVLKLIIQIVIINDNIELNYQKKDQEIEKRKNPEMTIVVFEVIKKEIDEKYEKIISPLERKKRRILDILPFIKVK